jgi:hypothetical protein
VESAVSELMWAGRGFLPRKMVLSPECGCVFVPMKSILGRLHTAPRSQAALSLVCLFVLILVVRLIIPGPITEPDSDTYSELGRNLMQYHCFGWVDEETGVCSPIWGTQPPGYPLLLGAVQPPALKACITSFSSRQSFLRSQPHMRSGCLCVAQKPDRPADLGSDISAVTCHYCMASLGADGDNSSRVGTVGVR